MRQLSASERASRVLKLLIKRESWSGNKTTDREEKKLSVGETTGREVKQLIGNRKGYR